MSKTDAPAPQQTVFYLIGYFFSTVPSLYMYRKTPSFEFGLTSLPIRSVTFMSSFEVERNNYNTVLGTFNKFLIKESDPGRIRTCNQQSRNLPFYPVELQGLDTGIKNTKILWIFVIFKK